MRTVIFSTLLLLFLSCKTQSSSTGLKNELLDIYKLDQLYRAEMAKVKPTNLKIVELVHKQDSVDAINLKRVTFILDSIGYPKRQEYGDSAGLATFFVIQHADIKHQEKYLPLFKQAAKDGEIKWKNVVYMIDRVRLEKGEKQIYGTQIQPVKDPVTGYLTDKAMIAPIEDEAQVNERRAKVGLGTIEQEAKEFGINYTPTKN
ncbi:MAG: DUF6624 domain-containing protein [Ginsengibacter sp.]